MPDPGLPVPEARNRALSHFEFWPAWAFYAPVWIWIVWLSLRYLGPRKALLANPGLPAGGLVGEEKHITLAAIKGKSQKLVPRWVAVQPHDRQKLDKLLEANKLRYPFVAKPDIGCRGAGVRPIYCHQELETYLRHFPENETLILQEMASGQGEAGIFYIRHPGHDEGQIFSLTLKYFPTVTGDGISTLLQLIGRDRRASKVQSLYRERFSARLHEIISEGQHERLVFSGSHSKGAIFQNGATHITEKLRKKFDKIADDIEGFHFGRFDVRFTDLEKLRRGKQFAIIELNGAGAEATHIWDSDMGLLQAWVILFRQFNLLFQIGAKNRALGFRPEGWRAFFRKWRRERSLKNRYPLTA